MYDITYASDTKGRPYIERGEIKGLNPLFEAPKEDKPSQFEPEEASRARPWDDWDDWDFRSCPTLSFIYTIYFPYRNIERNTTVEFD